MEDAYAWLEDVDGDRALAWVRERNAEVAEFADPLFAELRDQALEVLEADDRIAFPTVHGDEVRNFWTDAQHRRGLWRRTTWDDYLTGDPGWETLLDVDALGAAEGESWVFHGAEIRPSDRRRALVDLSPGGSDASVTREFDLVSKTFVDGGFERPLAKGSLTWIDDDTVYVTTDLGPGTTTRSGYARQVRRWSRGTPLAEAELVYEAQVDDMMVSVDVGRRPGFEHHVITRRTGFYSGETFLLLDGVATKIEVPDDVETTVEAGYAFVELRTDWGSFAAGSLLVAALGVWEWRALFVPTGKSSLTSWGLSRSFVVLNVLTDVRNRASRLALGTWTAEDLPGIDGLWDSHASAVDADDSDDLWLQGEDFTHPLTLQRLDDTGHVTPVVVAPSRFDATGMTVEQHLATSLDGTQVPYFQVGRPGVQVPTLLSGYGGFEISRLPAYGGVLGRAWLAAGGTYVLANIRGGGEYGPRWHRAGLRENRPRAYEDFEAVARDLVARGVTTAAELGCMGGSNGGLLVGNMYTRSPELFGAIVCQVPLLDMRRYPHLLAGASWMAEYGDPDDPADWAFIEGFSPYHQVRAEVAYPPLLLTTSTRDDRVHPAHARKMAARLRDLGKDVTSWENVEGGHGGAADALQSATMQALIWTFLRRRLMP